MGKFENSCFSGEHQHKSNISVPAAVNIIGKPLLLATFLLAASLLLYPSTPFLVKFSNRMGKHDATITRFYVHTANRSDHLHHFAYTLTSSPSLSLEKCNYEHSFLPNDVVPPHSLHPASCIPPLAIHMLPPYAGSPLRSSFQMRSGSSTDVRCISCAT
jgi:hypothetical protein